MQYDLWFDHVKYEFSVSIPHHLANVKTNIKIKTDTECKMSKSCIAFVRVLTVYVNLKFNLKTLRGTRDDSK